MANISDVIGNLDENANPNLNSGTEYLRHINQSVDDILKILSNMSQSSAREYAEDRARETRQQARSGNGSTYQNAQSRSSRSTNEQNRTSSRERERQHREEQQESKTSFRDIKDAGKKAKSSAESMMDDFMDSIESEFLHGVLGFDLQDKVKESLSQFEEGIGMSLQDVPGAFGKELGQKLSKSFNDSKFGDRVKEAFRGTASAVEDQFKSGFEDAANKFRNWGQSTQAEGQEPQGKPEGEKTESKNRGESEIHWDDVFKKTQSTQAEGQEPQGKPEGGPILHQSSDNLADDIVSGISRSRGSEATRLNSLGSSSEVLLLQSIDTNVEKILVHLAGPEITGGDLDENSPMNQMKKTVGESAQSGIKEALSDAAEGQSGATGAGQLAETAMVNGAGGAAEGMSAVLTAGEGAAGALGGIASAAMAVAPELLAIWAASKALSFIMNGLSDVVENTKQVFSDIAKSANRDNQSRKKQDENARSRLEADMQTLVEEPFNILRDAAQELYNTWDEAVREINATQGYTKSELQDLMSAYSQRLEAEGLSAVVSTSDVTDNLSRVLEAGLSGQAAEEFAYLATVLNAAIPTQDFFQYADTYAQIASLAMQSGMSQADAIAYANSQLEDFASSVLYASRELSGGFTTGLTDASSLLSSAVSIAQSAGTSDYSDIASVLAATSAYVGSVAPTLTSSITDMIVSLATGGNSSELTALRSLAGTGASNTAFLNAFVQNPQDVLTTLFTNLGNMQNMSDNAYMEVAQSLSSLFGISMDALAQIDFNYLAKAISAMDLNADSLDENLALLASGETTTSAEAERIAQINEYMADEGLAYVLDNEAARSIQEHFWDQEIADELMEAEYAVNLKGDAMSALTSLQNLGSNILKILTLGTYKTWSNIEQTVEEALDLDDEIEAILEAGVVGTGSSASSQQLYYNLAHPYNYESEYQDLLTVMQGTQALYTSGAGLSDALAGASSSAISQALGSNRLDTGVNSMYTWGNVSKSVAASVNSLYGGTPTGSSVNSVVRIATTSATEEIASNTQAKLDRMLNEEYMQSFVDAGKSYQDWVDSAKDFGIADFETVLQDNGYSLDNIQQYWQDLETNAGVNEEIRRSQREEDFWDNTEYWEADISEYFEENNDLLDYANELLETCNELLEEIYAKHTEFYDAWVDYYVNHTAYSNAYDHTAVAEIQAAEKSGSSDAVYALAEVLTKNSVDLLDPTVQTNALLSQILIVVNAIMQQNNTTTGNLSLSDTLSGLALGIINQT